MSVAREGLTERLLNKASPFWRANFPALWLSANLIRWIWPSRLRRQIVALKIVGSSPIIHPIKNGYLRVSVLFIFELGLEQFNAARMSAAGDGSTEPNRYFR